MQIDANWIESRKEAIFQQQSISLARSSLDTVFAEITRLREAIEAAEATRDECLKHLIEFAWNVSVPGNIYERSRNLIVRELGLRDERPLDFKRRGKELNAFREGGRDCLAKIAAVLGKETGT